MTVNVSHGRLQLPHYRRNLDLDATGAFATAAMAFGLCQKSSLLQGLYVRFLLKLFSFLALRLYNWIRMYVIHGNKIA